MLDLKNRLAKIAWLLSSRRIIWKLKMMIYRHLFSCLA